MLKKEVRRDLKKFDRIVDSLKMPKKEGIKRDIWEVRQHMLEEDADELRPGPRPARFLEPRLRPLYDKMRAAEEAQQKRGERGVPKTIEEYDTRQKRVLKEPKGNEFGCRRVRAPPSCPKAGKDCAEEKARTQAWRSRGSG